MKKDHTEYLKWIINELNNGLELNPFTGSMHSPISYNETVGKDGKIKQPDRLFVAAEIYRWVMGGKWRLLELENLISRQKNLDTNARALKKDIKELIDHQDIANNDVLKMCLLLTGIKSEIVNDPKYVLQKRAFYTHNANKLWSSIGYYNMKNKSIHLITGTKIKNKEYKFASEDIIQTAAHELGHHIYISLLSKRLKTKPGQIRKIRKLLKGVKAAASDREHQQWVKFYKNDYSKDWEKNKNLHLIPKEIYVRYGIESELFAQIISGKSTMPKTKRKELISLVNRAELA